MTDAATSGSITLRGSAKMIREFIWYGFNSILYQRGVYGAEEFTREKKYGLQLLVTNQRILKNFLHPLLEQIEAWLTMKCLKSIVLVIMEVNTKKVVERWVFDFSTDGDIEDGESRKTDESRIQKEMAYVIRQITASVTFLPLLETMCTFDVLSYTSKNAPVPNTEDWADTTQCLIEDCQEVDLRKVSTSIHNVAGKVQYKTGL
ncbi:MDF-2 protein [Aphelenchoides avenae]|nr:MDF-2 protein [Aphelenchus avenae]